MTDTQSLARRIAEKLSDRLAVRTIEEAEQIIAAELAEHDRDVHNAAIEAAALVAYNDGKCEYDNYEITEQIRELKKG